MKKNTKGQIEKYLTQKKKLPTDFGNNRMDERKRDKYEKKSPILRKKIVIIERDKEGTNRKKNTR